MGRKSIKFRVKVWVVTIILLGMFGSTFAQESWPSDSHWTHLIDVDWNPTQDPADQSTNSGYTEFWLMTTAMIRITTPPKRVSFSA